jgi:hypothetical protein
MRYEINHVLEGIVLTRRAKLEALFQELGDKAQTLADAKAKRAGGPRALADLLRERANQVDNLQVLSRDDFQAVTNAVTRWERALPSQYDVDNQARLIDLQQKEYDALATLADTADTRLEQFLRALLAGGETQVSQHSLKQSGFAVDKLTDCIVARLNAQAAKA